MKSSVNRAWRMLVSLSAFLVMGLCTTGFVLADHDAPAVTPDLSADVPDDPGERPTPPEIILLPPVDPEPDPRPDPVPEPDPQPEPDPGTEVIVLNPGQDPGEVDARGRFTGDASFDDKSLGDHEFVYIISGRTLDERGNPIPGARVAFFIDAYGFLGTSSRGLEETGCEPKPRKIVMPLVEGFSDRNAQFRLRLAYYDAEDARRDGFLGAEREGYRRTTEEAGLITLSSTEMERDIELAKGATATGRCVDRYGNPVVGVNVSAYGDTYSASAITDADGEFTLGGLGDGAHAFYVYSDTHYLAEGELKVELVSGQERQVSDIKLVTRTSGVVELNFPEEVDADWLDGTLSIVDANGNNLFTTWFSVTHEDGGYVARFSLEGMPEGAFNAKVAVSGSVIWEGEIWMNAREGELNDLGTVYLRKTDQKPVRPEPCRIKPCG